MFQNVENCFIRGDVLRLDRVHDHCHFTENYRGVTAHSICNLNYKITKFIPIFLQNFHSYY